MELQEALDTVCATSIPTTDRLSTASQDQCANALSALTNNAASCTPTSDEPRIICFGACRDIYDTIIQNCSPVVSSTVVHTYVCCL